MTDCCSRHRTSGHPDLRTPGPPDNPGQSGTTKGAAITPPASQLAISAEGLTKRFGTTQALAGIDLAVAPGTVLGVLGPNGAGKTTAVRILSTLVKPDVGTARVLGVDVARDPEQVRRSIGLSARTCGRSSAAWSPTAPRCC